MLSILINWRYNTQKVNKVRLSFELNAFIWLRYVVNGSAKSADGRVVIRIFSAIFFSSPICRPHIQFKSIKTVNIAPLACCLCVLINRQSVRLGGDDGPRPFFAIIFGIFPYFARNFYFPLLMVFRHARNRKNIFHLCRCCHSA